MLASARFPLVSGAATLELFRPWDVIYILDFPILAFFFFKNGFEWITVPFNKRASFAITSMSALSDQSFSLQKLTVQARDVGSQTTMVVRALGLPCFF